MVSIGIPRALFFFDYEELIVPFFENLGVEVVFSPLTNKAIVNEGTSHTVDDACIPIKVFIGHVMNLKDRVDYLFIPRIMGIREKEYICPKFCGLPEIVRYSIKDLPPIIEPKIDLTKDTRYEQVLFEVGHYFTQDDRKIRQAFKKAWEHFNVQQPPIRIKTKPIILLLGHPYILKDTYLNMNIEKKLIQKGFDVWTPDLFTESMMNEYALTYHGKLFWLFFRRMLGVCLYVLDQQMVEGIIYLTSFGCGIDSVVAETVERRIRRESLVPYMLLTLDEHSGEAGFNTRIEAFTDLIDWRNLHDHNLSTYGGHLYSH